MKNLFLITLLTAILLSSCSKEELVLVNGIIHGTVMDYYNTKTISGATVEYQLDGETMSVTSDSSGYFTISGLVPGDYNLKISHFGYLSENVYAWIEPMYNAPTVKKGGQVDYVDNIEARLPELTVSVSGTIKKYVGPNNVLMPAANQLVTIQVNDYDYIPSTFETTTNANGEYFLDNLPATYIRVYVYPSSDEDNYYSNNYSNYWYAQSGTNYTYSLVLSRSDAGIYLVSSSLDAGNGVYRYDVGISEDIMLNFNLELSEEQTLMLGGVSLTGVTFDPETDFSFSGSQLTINPPTNLTPDTDYTLTFQVYSTIPGDYTDGAINFHTEAP